MNIENIFTYHAPHGDQGERYSYLRLCAKKMAQDILDKCPESDERTLAIRKLQECIMYANAAIAINESDNEIMR
mgnify:CR=1 FL=1